MTVAGSETDVRAFLESLRSGLGVRDEVVCLVPAGRPELRRLVEGHSWLRVLADVPDAPAARWAAGIAATRHALVALVDGDVVLPAQWRDPLVGAFDDAGVVAAGPRVHNSFGPQGAEVPKSALASIADFKGYARQWRQERRGQLTEVDRLGPVCVVVRRAALEAAGGPGAELPWAGLREHGRIVVVQPLLVAHVGGPGCSVRVPRAPGAPLVSASLIVKNEEAVLGECLTALDGVVDEIVVYDTGSTDRTREIAREHGAKVVEGYWDDHFGDARNRCLEHCAGEWVLWVDADEVVTGDAVVLRERLEESAEVAYLLIIRNVEEAGSQAFVAPRLFRGDRARFAARLHEQVLDHATGAALSGPAAPEVSLIHSGYTVATFAGKGKAERNIKLAELAVADQVLGSDAVVNLARSQFAADDMAGGVDTALAGLRTPGLSDRIRISLLMLVIRGCSRLDRADEARAAFDELGTLAKKPVTMDHMEVHLRFGEGQYARVLELIEAFPEAAEDDQLLTIERRHLVGLQMESLMHLGRAPEAADLLRDALRHGRLPTSLAGATAILQEAGSTVEEIASLVPRDRLRWLVHSAGQADPQLAEAVADALHRRYPDEAIVLGFVAWMGERLPLMRALEWSARLRAAGYADRCPLLAIARSERRAVRDRVLAAAIAQETFADPAALPLLTGVLPMITEVEAEPVLAQLRLLAPGIASAVEPAGAR